MARPTTAWVLAAGLGTRLRPLTTQVPKPLVEVCGTPLVVHALGLLARAGITRVAMNSHWLHPALQRALGDRFTDASSGAVVSLHYVHEPEILGTGGGLLGLRAALPPPPGEKVVVQNADALIDLDFERLFAADDSARAALVLKHTVDAADYGLIGTDVDERITTFAGRVPAQGPVARERMFCGVHLMDPAVLDSLPPVTLSNGVASGTASGINDEGYPPLLSRGEKLVGVDHAGTFCDTGTPERLLEANLSLLTGVWAAEHLRPFAGLEVRPGRVFVSKTAVIEDGAVLKGPVVVHHGAVVERGAIVGYAVIGPNSRVAADARVVASVLHSGAVAVGRVQDAILAPNAALAVPRQVAAKIWAAYERRGRR